MAPLRKLSDKEVRCVMMQVARAKISLNYWTCYIRDIISNPQMKHLYKQELKMHLNNALKHADIYLQGVNNTFSPDVVEAIDDQVSKFYDWKGNVISRYEKAIKSALDKLNYPNSDFLMHCAVSKDLVSVAATMLGMEAASFPSSTREVGDLHMEEIPPAHRIVCKGQKLVPTTMATMLRIVESVNLEILEKMGLENARLEAGFDEEIERSMSICAKNIIDFFTEYDLWMVMLERKDMTIEEAIKIVEERKNKGVSETETPVRKIKRHHKRL